jgi:hypothetical protein
VIKSKKMRLVRHVDIEKMVNAYKILAGKRLVQSSLRRHEFSWKDNIKIYFKEMRCGSVD